MKNEKKLSWSYNLTFRYINDVISLNLPSLVTLLIAYIPLSFDFPFVRLFGVR